MRFGRIRWCVVQGPHFCCQDSEFKYKENRNRFQQELKENTNELSEQISQLQAEVCLPLPCPALPCPALPVPFCLALPCSPALLCPALLPHPYRHALPLPLPLPLLNCPCSDAPLLDHRHTTARHAMPHPMCRPPCLLLGIRWTCSPNFLKNPKLMSTTRE